jgi:hypothetical protein
MARYGEQYGRRPGWRPEPVRGRYGGSYGRGAVPLEGYGYGFRRGYDRQGGFGPSGPRAQARPARAQGYGVSRWRDPGGGRYDAGYGRRYPAWPGELRVGRRYGHGYGRG